ncbi:MAG TPA: hypothetical protein ENI23_14825 [bacterium]|nr:hypothetical protein [bacterium]
MLHMMGPEGSKLAIVRDQPTQEEMDHGRAFGTWNTKIFKDCMIRAGTSEIQCYTGYICPKMHSSGRFEGYYTDKNCIFPSEYLISCIDSFRMWLEKHRPNVIVTVGALATRILTGQPNFEDIRGYIVPSCISDKHIFKVLPTFPPMRIFAEQHHMFTVTMDLKKALASSMYPDFAIVNKTLIPNATPDQFIEYCDWIVESTEHNEVRDKRYPHAEEVLTGVALDIENTIGNGCHITQFGIGHSGDYSMTINLLNGKTPALSEEDELRVWQAISRLAKSNAKFIAHNGVHDLCVTWLNNHILFTIDFDTMLAGQLLYAELLKSLKFLCSICLDVKPWKHISGEETYNPEDVANTKKLKEVLEKRLIARNLMSIFRREISQIPVASMMQLQGVRLDSNKRDFLLRINSKRIMKLKGLLDKEAIKACGSTINYNSPIQVSKLLYVDLKLPIQTKRRKSVKDKQKTTTDQEALIVLCQKTNSIVPKLMIKHRKASKALSTYLDISTSPKNTVHTSYNIGSTTERFKQKGTADSKSLGRWSSSESIILPYGSGNLQSIPPYARSMYITFNPEEDEMACGDYVQAEAVVVAYLSNDEPLIKSIERGKALRDALRNETSKRIIKIIKKKLREVDMHRTKAMELFSVTNEEVTSDQRYLGKQTRHATNYISGPRVLQAFAAKGEIYKEISYWKNLMRIDEIRSPAKYKWHQAIVDELSANKRVLTNSFERHRKFLGEWNEDLFKAGCAFKPQSTIGDLLNTGMVDLYNKHGSEVRILMQLHDGMYISYPKKDRVKWLNRLRECMTIPIIINGREVIIDVEMKVGPNWGNLEDVNY